MATTNSTKIPFGIFFGEKYNIVGLFSDFIRIEYVAKRYNIKGHMNDKTYKAVMVGYSENQTCNTYKLYNPKNGNNE